MSLLDTLFNIGSSAVANKRAYQYTRDLQQHQYNLNRQALREYYSNNRFSLEQAGYNPLLAVPGSTAQGFSASASMSPVMPGSSGAGTDELNAVNSALSQKEQRKVAKQTVKQSEEHTRSLALDNKKKELDLKTNLKNIFVEGLEGKGLPDFVVNGVKKLKEKGIDVMPSSAVSNAKVKLPVISLHDGKPYVQKGVPKSVVKAFNSANSAYAVLDRIPRNPHIGTYELKGYRNVKNYNNKPPKNFPSGM